MKEYEQCMDILADLLYLYLEDHLNPKQREFPTFLEIKTVERGIQFLKNHYMELECNVSWYENRLNQLDQLLLNRLDDLEKFRAFINKRVKQ